MRRQCQLLGVSRSTFYYQPATESEDNLHLIRQIDEQYMQTPFYGSRRMTEHLKRLGYHVNRKRIQRPYAFDGHRSDLSQTQGFSQQQRASDLPIPITGL